MLAWRFLGLKRVLLTLVPVSVIFALCSYDVHECVSEQYLSFSLGLYLSLSPGIYPRGALLYDYPLGIPVRLYKLRRFRNPKRPGHGLSVFSGGRTQPC